MLFPHGYFVHNVMLAAAYKLYRVGNSISSIPLIYMFICTMLRFGFVNPYE